MIIGKGIHDIVRLFFLLMIPVYASAANSSHFPVKNLEISAAGGLDWYTIADSELIISSSETDSDKVHKISRKGAWKAGFGYYFFEENLQQRNYFNHLLLELNIYQTSTTVSGDVWQYESPIFNNYHFSAPITSTRIMLDVKPHLFTWRQMTPYIIAGVGATWNTVSYDETANNINIPSNSALSLSEETTTQLVWDIGAGANVMLEKNFYLTAEYIYSFLGHGSPADHANNVNLIKPPRFSLRTQSFLLGFMVKL